MGAHDGWIPGGIDALLRLASTTVCRAPLAGCVRCPLSGDFDPESAARQRPRRGVASRPRWILGRPVAPPDRRDAVRHSLRVVGRLTLARARPSRVSWVHPRRAPSADAGIGLGLPFRSYDPPGPTALERPPRGTSTGRSFPAAGGWADDRTGVSRLPDRIRRSPESGLGGRARDSLRLTQLSPGGSKALPGERRLRRSWVFLAVLLRAARRATDGSGTWPRWPAGGQAPDNGHRRRHDSLRLRHGAHRGQWPSRAPGRRALLLHSARQLAVDA